MFLVSAENGAGVNKITNITYAFWTLYLTVPGCTWLFYERSSAVLIMTVTMMMMREAKWSTGCREYSMAGNTAGSDGHHSVNTILMSFPPVTQHHEKEQGPELQKVKKK